MSDDSPKIPDYSTTWATSEEIAELAKALSEFQKVNPVARQSKENPHFKSSYADLRDVTDVATQAADLGLSWTQLLTNDTKGDVAVTTLLMHTSGQWVRSTVCLPPTQRNPQGYGSSISYMRRYALSGLLGITTGTQDDDGDAASLGLATVNVSHVDWDKMIGDAGNDRELRRIYRQAQRAYEDDPDKFAEIEAKIFDKRGQPSGAADTAVAKGKGRKADGN